MANLIGVLVARTAKLGPAVRREGLGAAAGRLVAYTSAAAHGCIRKAMEIAGLGSDALRLIPVDGADRLVPAALAAAIAADPGAGCEPFLVGGTAGTVDTGGIDPFAAL